MTDLGRPARRRRAHRDGPRRGPDDPHHAPGDAVDAFDDVTDPQGVEPSPADGIDPSFYTALGGRAIAMMTDGSVQAYARAAFYAGLAAWAWEELVSGVNWVRRALGAGEFIYVVDKVAAALRA